MSHFDDINSWFEQELRSSPPVDSVRFDTVEATLSRRIRECESLGILGLLCQDEICVEETYESIEKNLFTQIAQYSEYDEPVNECVGADHDLTENQWDRIASKIDEKLSPVMQLPLWEQQVLAPQTEPTAGNWEAFEMHLFERINKLESHVVDSWEQYEISDSPIATSSLERAEMLLEDHIRGVAARPAWEHVLSADEIVPQHRWEVVEESLFNSIEEKEAIPLRKQPFWHILDQYTALYKGAIAAATMAVVVTTALFGVRSLKIDERTASSIVYQTEGSGAVQYNMEGTVGNRCSMVSGGKMTLVNVHGYVALHNQSALNIEKLSPREARYQVSFASDKGGAHGDVTFFVDKKDTRRKFTVETPHYRIEVRGTYFKLESAPDGSVTTRVLEGRVKVLGSPLGDTLLSAGQSIAIDTTTGRYKIYSGGEMVSREEAQSVPDIVQIIECPVVLFTSSIAGAHVYIDGKLKGMAPLRVRLPEGVYNVGVQKQGYVRVDSTVTVSRQHTQFAFVSVAEKKPKLAKTARRVSEVVKEVVQADSRVNNRGVVSRAVSTPKVSGPSVEASPLYQQAQKAEHNGNWRKAIDLYKKVFDDPATTPLRREDVLFSIGKLQTDNLHEAEAAKKSFLTYVALFPEGSFAGECWLRLAELEFQKNQESAIHYYLKFFSQFPRHPRTAELKDRVGVIYLQQKQFDKAITMFDQALGSTTSVALSQSVAVHLHRALLEKGDQERAEIVRTRYLLSER